MIRMTSTEPIITCSCTALIERSMNLALSSSSDSLTPGTSRLMRSISARTPSRNLHRVGARLLGAPACGRPALPLMRSTDRMSSVESFDLGDVAQVDRHAGLRVSTTRLRI